MLALTAASACYAALYSVDDIRVASIAICLLGMSLLWMLITVPVKNQADDEYRKLRFPWLIFVCGFVLLFVGLFLYLPNAVRMANESFWDAVDKGYDDHFEESEAIGLGIVMILILFGLPGVLLVGIGGAICSAHFNIQGIGRYSSAFALAMMPLVIGTLPTFGYMWTAFWLSDGG